MKRSHVAAWTLAFASLGVLAGCAVQRIDEARKLARASRPFSVHPPASETRLLIAGDSTAVGTGASSPERSLAGQLSKAMPGVSIANAGADGAKFADVADQLEATRNARFDAVLIQAGGNDVISLTGADKLRTDVERTIALAKALAPVVVIMPAGNVGNVPFFFPPVSWLMSARARKMHEVVRETAQREGVHYVNLYLPRTRTRSRSNRNGCTRKMACTPAMPATPSGSANCSRARRCRPRSAASADVRRGRSARRRPRWQPGVK